MELIDSIEAIDEPDMTVEDDVIEARGIGLGFVIYSCFILVKMMATMRDLTMASFSGKPFVACHSQ